MSFLMFKTVVKSAGKFLLLSGLFAALAMFSYQFSNYLVDSYISFEHAMIISKFFNGDEISEALEVTRDYLAFLINMSSSIIIYSAMKALHARFLHRNTPQENRPRLANVLVYATVLRMIKALFVMGTFWALLKYLPYEHFIVERGALPPQTVLTIGLTNAFSTVAIYLGVKRLWGKKFP